MTSRDPAPPRRPRATALLCVVAMLLQAFLPLAHRASHALHGSPPQDRVAAHRTGEHSQPGHDGSAATCAVCQLLNSSRSVIDEAPAPPAPLPAPRCEIARIITLVGVAPLRDRHPTPRGPPAAAIAGFDRSC